MTPAIHLDFVHPLPPRRKTATVLAVLALAVVVGDVWGTVAGSAEDARLAAEIDRARRTAPRDDASRRGAVVVDRKRLGEELAQANEVVARLSTPWSRLFEGIERATDPSVVLVGLQPEARGDRIRISGVARQYEDVLAYVDRLQNAPSLADVLLTSHEVQDDPQQGTSVAFTLSARWTDAP